MPGQTDLGAVLRLDAELEKRGWSVERLAREIERSGDPLRTVHARTIYRILADKHVPRRSVRYEIATALGLTPDSLWRRRRMATAMDPQLAGGGIASDEPYS